MTLARALGELGSTERALAETDAAVAAFEELTALRDAADAAELRRLLKPGTVPSGPLTRRELQVIALVSAGRSNREIAAKLVVSEHTVHRHISNILRKLGEPTRAAAAARATRDGLV
jgi:DNA-binding NarL/FixJ family response regulator